MGYLYTNTQPETMITNLPPPIVFAKPALEADRLTRGGSVQKMQTLIDLQIEFSEATEAMNKAWVIYRNARPDAAALDAYTGAMERCQDLKTAIYQFRVEGNVV